MPKGKKRVRKLTDKQELFCQKVAFDADINNSDAYRVAYNCANMKSTTVNRKACALHKQGNIRARIDQLRIEQMQRVEIDADYVLQRLIKMDQLDINDIQDDYGNILPVRRWPKEWRTSVSEMEVKVEASQEELTTLVKKIKYPNKLHVLREIGRHISVGAFSDKHHHTHEGSVTTIRHETVE